MLIVEESGRDTSEWFINHSNAEHAMADREIAELLKMNGDKYIEILMSFGAYFDGCLEECYFRYREDAQKCANWLHKGNRDVSKKELVKLPKIYKVGRFEISPNHFEWKMENKDERVIYMQAGDFDGAAMTIKESKDLILALQQIIEFYEQEPQIEVGSNVKILSGWLINKVGEVISRSEDDNDICEVKILNDSVKYIVEIHVSELELVD